MTPQRYQPVFSIASPVEIEWTARQLEVIRDEFLANGDLKEQIPRRFILESWRRCREMQVDTDQRYTTFPVIGESQLDALREADGSLIRAARPVIARLNDIMGEAGYVVALANASGWLLEVAGNSALRRKLAQAGLVPGSNWSELAAGTNALGTALVTEHVVQILASEHYCGGWRDISCTAAPIRHPLSGQILGALDLTGDYRLIRSFLPGFLAAAALEVEQGLQAVLPLQPGQERRRPVQFGGISIPNQPDSSNKAHKLAPTPAIACERLATPDPTAVNNLFSQLHFKERQARNAERLAAATGMISASLDLTMTIEQVARQMAHVLELECAAVCLFDESGAIATFHVWTKNSYLLPERERVLQTLIQPEQAVALIRERGEPVIYNDLLAAGRLSAAAIAQTDIQTMALLPLATAREVIGFVAAPRSLPVEWTADEVRLGLSLAAQAATALENASLFATVQQHNRYIEALNEMGQFLRTLPDPSQHLDRVLEQIVLIMGLDIGLILRLERDSGLPSLVVHAGLSPATVASVEQLRAGWLDLGRQIELSQQAFSVCLQEVDGSGPQQLLKTLGCCDLIAAPLLADETLLNLLLVGSYSHHNLGSEHLRLGHTLADQLALTLKNAQLLRSASEIAALREADRLKSEFLAAVSHDLRSPLTAIHTSLESLLESHATQPIQEQEYLLQHINGQVARLSQMVDQLLDLSRLEAGAFPLDRDWVDLPVVIEDVLTKFELFHGNYPVERYLSANLPLQYIDAASISQVLWNLLENAAKYAPPGLPIQVEAHWTGREVFISVADQGKGIPPGERQKIFQHFYRLKPHQQSHTPGSGLGLAICRGIVEAHGGRIWVEERPGGGSIFCITLPQSAAASAHFEELVAYELQASINPAT